MIKRITKEQINKGRRTKVNIVSYPQIMAILDGDIEATNAVVEHYRGYISKLARRNLYDEYGNVYSFIDEKIVKRLEMKLITAIVFDYELITQN